MTDFEVFLEQNYNDIEEIHNSPIDAMEEAWNAAVEIYRHELKDAVHEQVISWASFDMLNPDEIDEIADKLKTDRTNS